MARSWFGGTHLDMVIRSYRFGAHRLADLAVNTKVTFWDAAEGGNQITDLLAADGSPVNSVTTDGDGWLPQFQGPDGVRVMWADAGFGRRFLMVTTDGAIDLSTQLSTRIPTSEKGAPDGVATLDASGRLVEPVPADSVEGGVVQSVVAGLGTEVDNTDPSNPVISAAASTTASDTLAGGTYTVDRDVAQWHFLDLIADTTLDVANLTEGRSVRVLIQQDDTGGWEVTLPLWLGAENVNLTSTAGHFDVLTIWRSPLGVHVTQIVADGQEWAPNLLADQIGWYDADELTAADGSTIGVWPNQWAEKDLVGAPSTARHPTVETINGVRVLRFDSANDRDHLVTGDTEGGGGTTWANGPYTQPITIGIVAKVAAASTDQQTLVSANEDTGDTNIHVLGSGSGSLWEIENGNNLTSTEADDNAWTTVIAIYNGASSALRIDGVETTGGTGANGSSSLRLGTEATGTLYTDFDLAELVMVGHVVSGDELTKLEQYLNAKRDTLAGV